MPKLCLSLTGSKLDDDLALAQRYRDRVDLYELRVDCLSHEERFYLRRFPGLVDKPVILTVRRRVDGGKYTEGEGTRTVLLAKGLAFADEDPRKNFAFMDIEDDFHAPGVEEAARTFGTLILRSIFERSGDIGRFAAKVASCKIRDGELLRLAPQLDSTKALARLLELSQDMATQARIVAPSGPMSLPARILARRFGSAIVYANSAEEAAANPLLGLIDPETLEGTYRFREQTQATKVYGIIGNPLVGSKSPAIHNSGFKALGIDSVYLPFRTSSVEDFMTLAEALPVEAFSVTVPFKEDVLGFLEKRGEEVEAIKACNTVVREGGAFTGHNTDAPGFQEALLEFLGGRNPKGMKASIIGAGGAAHAVAFALKQMGMKACVLNRTPVKAKRLAELFGFSWAPLDGAGIIELESHSELIVQTTSAGMSPREDEDPLELYDFSGKELVYDLIYKPEETKLLRRAREAGCRTQNGYGMLQYQAYRQFKLFSGRDYPNLG
jgi:3-dehydroquinate dehydratase / shikimate dehydrogenase